MTHNKNDISISEQVLEIRYKPNPVILDKRGSWAESISKEMSLPEWNIVQNRIEVHNKDKKDLIFVGFRNCGYISHNVPTSNYFPDKAIKFVKFIHSLDGFNNPLFIERIGVRSRFISEFKGKFEELRERYSNRFLRLTDEAKEIISAKVVDIGGPIDFLDKYGNFNTFSGPMLDKQMKQSIASAEKYPDVGLYFDIDYWQKPQKYVQLQDIVSMVKAFSNESWSRHEKVKNLIYKD